MLFNALVGLAATAAVVSAQSLTDTLSGAPDLSTLTTIVSQYPDLVAALSAATNITILAPSNDAFAKLLASPAGAALAANDTARIQAVLSYHVLQGAYPASAITTTPTFVHTLLNDTAYTNVTGGQVVEVLKVGDGVKVFSGAAANSSVTTADVKFNGGVVHIIDSVLTLPLNISATATAANLTQLVSALGTAELVETVDGLKDVTVFAPNDDAFDAIGSALPGLSKEQLTSILTYHVINGTVGYSSSLSNDSKIPTVNGANVTVTIQNGTVYVNSAKVVIADVLVANGVVHVIDNVLNPNATTLTPNTSQSTQPPAFSGASATATASTTDTASTTATATGNAAAPMMTGAMGMGALFGGAVVLANL